MEVHKTNQIVIINITVRQVIRFEFKYTHDFWYGIFLSSRIWKNVLDTLTALSPEHLLKKMHDNRSVYFTRISCPFDSQSFSSSAWLEKKYVTVKLQKKKKKLTSLVIIELGLTPVQFEHCFSDDFIKGIQLFPPRSFRPNITDDDGIIFEFLILIHRCNFTPLIY